jgi:hypothetical protein
MPHARRITILALALVAALALASTASATTTQFSGLNCSATAEIGASNYAGVSCGGSQYNLYKAVTACGQVYNANGNWYTISGSCQSSGVSTANPTTAVPLFAMYSGHTYRIAASPGEVYYGGWRAIYVYSQPYTA